MKKIKEWFRKKLVSLKRNPQHIPLLMLCISCIVFNIRLTAYSNTIAQINEPGMGICSFIIVLCSFLSIISFISAFPRRKKPKLMSIVLVFIMLILSIVCQAIFYYFIIYGTVLKENPIIITQSKIYILKARNMCIIHIILLIFTIILIALQPVYGKLLQKINTSIKIEEGTKIKDIIIDDEQEDK